MLCTDIYKTEEMTTCINMANATAATANYINASTIDIKHAHSPVMDDSQLLTALCSTWLLMNTK
jgi:hypothetical protein